MYKKASLLVFLISLIVGLSAAAQVPTGYKVLTETASFKKKLSVENQKVNTTESQFIQEKYLSVLSEKIVSQGKFYFKKQNLES